MAYITRSELRLVNALRNWGYRPLTPVEEGIKQLWSVSRYPVETQDQRNAKKDALEMVKGNLEMLASDNHLLLERVAECVKFPANIPALVERYPYVEFEEVLRNKELPRFARMFGHGRSEELLKEAFTWGIMFQHYVNELPIGRRAFIGTPNTDYFKMKMAGKAFPECYGYNPGIRRQETFRQLFVSRQAAWAGRVFLEEELYTVSEEDMINRFDFKKEFLDDLIPRRFQVAVKKGDQYGIERYLSFTRLEEDGRITEYNFVL